MKRMMHLALAGALAVTLAGAAPAGAQAGDVSHHGTCSGRSVWKLKLSPQDNGIEVEYEVDSNKVGQAWNVKLFQNGNRIFAGQRVTKAPSGSFTVRKLATDTAGTDSFRGRAVNQVTGEITM